MFLHQPNFCPFPPLMVLPPSIPLTDTEGAWQHFSHKEEAFTITQGNWLTKLKWKETIHTHCQRKKLLVTLSILPGTAHIVRIWLCLKICFMYTETAAIYLSRQVTHLVLDTTYFLSLSALCRQTPLCEGEGRIQSVEDHSSVHTNDFWTVTSHSCQFLLRHKQVQNRLITSTRNESYSQP